MSITRRLSSASGYFDFINSTSLYLFARELSKEKQVLDWNVRDPAGFELLAAAAAAAAGFCETAEGADVVRKRCARLSGVTVHVGSPMAKRLREASFDVIVAAPEPASPAEVAAVVKRMRKLLSPNGVLVVGFALPDAEGLRSSAGAELPAYVQSFRDELKAQFKHCSYNRALRPRLTLVSMPEDGPASEEMRLLGRTIYDSRLDPPELAAGPDDLYLAISSDAPLPQLSSKIIYVPDDMPFGAAEDDLRSVNRELASARALLSELEGRGREAAAERDAAQSLLEGERQASARHRQKAAEMEADRATLRRAVLLLADEQDALRADTKASQELVERAAANETRLKQLGEELARSEGERNDLKSQIATHIERSNVAQEEAGRLKERLESSGAIARRFELELAEVRGRRETLEARVEIEIESLRAQLEVALAKTAELAMLRDERFRQAEAALTELRAQHDRLSNERRDLIRAYEAASAANVELGGQVRQLAAELTQARDAAAAQKGDLDGLQSEVDDLSRRNNVLAEESEAARALSAELQAKLRDATASLSRARQEAAAAQKGDLEALQSEVDGLSRRNNILAQESEAASALAAELHAKLRDATASLSRARQEAITANSDMMLQNEELRRRADLLAPELAEARRAAAAQKMEADALRAGVDELSRRNSVLVQDVESSTSQVAQLDARLKEAAMALSRMRQDATSFHAANDDLGKRAADAERRLGEANAAWEEKQRELQEADARHKALDRRLGEAHERIRLLEADNMRLAESSLAGGAAYAQAAEQLKALALENQRLSHVISDVSDTLARTRASRTYRAVSAYRNLYRVPVLGWGLRGLRWVARGFRRAPRR